MRGTACLDADHVIGGDADGLRSCTSGFSVAQGWPAFVLLYSSGIIELLGLGGAIWIGQLSSWCVLVVWRSFYKSGWHGACSI